MKVKNHGFLFKPVFYIISLLAGTCLVLWIEKLKPSDIALPRNLFQREVIIPKQKHYPLRTSNYSLSFHEKFQARIAWKYFQNNYHESTGWVNGTDEKRVVSISEQTAFLMALLSAYETEIIDSLEMDRKLIRFMASLKHLPLCSYGLPNKWYDPSDLTMLDEQSLSSEKGTGWSAIEIGRFYAFVNKIDKDYPAYRHLLNEGIKRWNMDEMITSGFLYAGTLSEKKEIKEQEGQLGFEEYCAKNLVIYGYDVYEALVYTDFLKFVEINHQEVGVDTRKNTRCPTSCLQSTPYLLDGIEYGWDLNSRELAYRVYNAQHIRYKKEKILTAVSCEYVNAPADYVCYAIYANGKPWNCTKPNGDNADNLRFFSTKAAWGWYVLYDDEYSGLLHEAMQELNDPGRGWYAGRYENNGVINKAITATTNGMVLEALNYKMNGKIIGR